MKIQEVLGDGLLLTYTVGERSKSYFIARDLLRFCMIPDELVCEGYKKIKEAVEQEETNETP